jgi:hypothetical protein
MLSLACSSLGYAPTPVARAGAVRMGASDMPGIGPETGDKIFDPLGFTKFGSEKTLAWYRASELKHGRVCMLASVGIAYTALGLPLFGGKIALDGTTFASLGAAKDPWAAFDAVPASGKLQMLLVIGALEFASEYSKPHYLSGGTPGKIMVGGYPLFDPIGFMSKLTPEQKAYKLESEIKNGRLAMIGVAGFFAAHWSPNAVPLLIGKIPLGDPANPLFGLS